jgi:5-methylcytosine-specific restriction endonuclease McrA
MSEALKLNKRVLVLNRCWTAIKVHPLRDVLSLLFSHHTSGPYKDQPKAKIIDPTQDFRTFTWADWSDCRPVAGEETIRGGGMDFRIPEVVLLTEYDKLPEQRLQFSRKTIYRRDNSKCQYCGDKLTSDLLTIDHVLPSSKGGKSTWENCVLACGPCNRQKADRLLIDCIRGKKQANFHPITNTNGWKGPSPMILLKEPKKPKFNDVIRGDRQTIPKSWDHFISLAYWETELDNDNLD